MDAAALLIPILVILTAVGAAATLASLFVVIYEVSAPFNGAMRVSDEGWIAPLARLPLIH